ncbi:GTPase HflX [Xylocopilactobacillus apicola]|uniref:GTPase HflX n=1 Tax=Xylocopilactobacillus apicola TaxID=2932184 RepID=A0AAU9DNV4_9LACO|nr:GTPase HflX [Xylocopilactobacillus apicola]BDR58782.1 GTPase HflX [Xylocopilactobacillus apicola]
MKKVIIAGVDNKDPRFLSQMAELKGLAVADDFEVVKQITQKLDHRLAGTYFGHGKLSEIKDEISQAEAEVLIVNDELSPTQIRNLEKILQTSVIDRTELILEIFKRRARTKEAKIQVEIAQLQYEMPRIHPSAQRLDQQGGGGGGLHNRGAGETKSEINRRTIVKQISELKNRLKKVELIHQTQSEQRAQSGLPSVALVGYTNAGKSTTFNNLPPAIGASLRSKEPVFSANMLFATLDTTIKSLRLTDQREFLLSDTVGFITGLPHQLIESFKTTLQEAKDADLLINVVDYADPNCEEMITTTQKVLAEIGAGEIPMITFYNKADLLPDQVYPLIKDNNIFGSANDSETLKQLGQLIIKNIFGDFKEVTLLIPFDQGEVASQIMANYPVISYEYLAEGTKILANLSLAAQGRFQKFFVKSN